MSSTSPVITLADLIERFGAIPVARIRHEPRPGTAKEQDVLEIAAREGRLYELLDGILLEKVMGFYESYLAATLVRELGNFVVGRDLGVIVGADGMVKLSRGGVHIPDAAFVSWAQLPGKRLPMTPIPTLAPDLVVEIISQGNTREEMQHKLRDYLQAGVRLVWFVYPLTRSVRVYSHLRDTIELFERDTLDGGDVLPGFLLPVANLFRVPCEPSGEESASTKPHGPEMA